MIIYIYITIFWCVCVISIFKAPYFSAGLAMLHFTQETAECEITNCEASSLEACNDLTGPPHWKSWFLYGKSSPNGRKIQVSEIL